MALPDPWIMAQSQHWKPGGLVLDLAAGSGRHARPLAARFRVLAVDRDERALAGMQAADGLMTCCHDLEDGSIWPFACQRFDAVLVSNYLYRPRLDAVFELVAAGGHIAYQTFAVGNAAFGRPSNPAFLLEEGELARHLPADFTLLEHFHGMAETASGKPAVIQRLAAKRDKN